MNEALRLAIAIIEAYQMEIRALELPPGATHTGGDQQRIEIIPGDNTIRTLADVGFCQGVVYKTAIERIKKKAYGYVGEDSFCICRRQGNPDMRLNSEECCPIHGYE